MDNQLDQAPELQWLKSSSIHATPEGIDVEGKEYLRTICSIRLLDYVLKNDYLAFVAAQQMDYKLTEDSFDEIRVFVESTLRTKDDIDAMKAFLIINDLGKVGDFVDKIKETMGFESVNHDVILYEGLKEHPEFSPTFSSLDKKYQELILEGLKTNFNMGQFVQSECLPVDLSPLFDIKKNALDFYMVHVLFDIAGAKGQENPNSSAICTEMYWKRFSFALDVIHDMIRHKQSASYAYNAYLKMTMKYFALASPLERSVDMCVARLYNMLLITTADEAIEVEEGFWNLPYNIRNTLCEEFIQTGEHGADLGILIYYLPALLRNALSYYKKVRPYKAISWMISNIAPKIYDIYRVVRMLGEYGGNTGKVTVVIADVAKAALDSEKMLQESLSFIRVGDAFEVKIGEDPKACLILRAKTNEKEEV